MQPPTSARTVTTYDLPTDDDSGQVPRLTVFQCPTSNNCSVGERLSWQRSIFDGLGRRTRERREVLTAGGPDLISRDFAYNGMGWKTEESLWGLTGQTVTETFRILLSGREVLRPPSGA